MQDKPSTWASTPGARTTAGFYSYEGSPDGQPSQLAVICWGKAGEPDLMVIYNENDRALTVNNLQDWSQGDWKLLARSWFGEESDFGSIDDMDQLPNADSSIEVKGRSMAILISDNN
jgi:isoamylase